MAGQVGLQRSTPVSGDGTAPEDLQRLLAGLFINSAQSPVLSGGAVTGRADLRYNFTAGGGLKATSAGAVYYTWATGITGFTTPPASGTRSDVIYVIDHTGPKVGVAPAPANAIILGTRVIAAGASTTNSTTAVGSQIPAVSGSVRGGRILEWHSGIIGGSLPVQLPWPLTSIVTQEFTMPVAGTLRGHIKDNLTSDVDTQVTTLNAGSARYRVKLDSVERVSTEVGYDVRWSYGETDFTITGVTAGNHTIQLTREGVWAYPPYAFPGAELVLTLDWAAV